MLLFEFHLLGALGSSHGYSSSGLNFFFLASSLPNVRHGPGLIISIYCTMTMTMTMMMMIFGILIKVICKLYYDKQIILFVRDLR